MNTIVLFIINNNKTNMIIIELFLNIIYVFTKLKNIIWGPKVTNLFS